ncbi:MAG: hypothetical protein OIF57_06680 [Marinobacterium sp.]|nr:hypothetical protein [Marinobacterium sp.]
MTDLLKYSEDDLQELIQAEGLDDDFVPGYLDSVAGVLNKNPTMYRSYGPYWWPLKRLLIQRGHQDLFGTEVDDSVADQLTYTTDQLTVAAIYSYSERVMAAGTMYSNSQLVDTPDGAESYLIADEEIEGIIAVINSTKAS